MTTERRNWAGIIGRIVAGALGGAAAVLWVFTAFIVLSSLFSSDPASDPHGFGLILGFPLAIISGLVAAAAVPWSFPSHSRVRVTRVAMATYGIATALLIAAGCAS